MQAAVVMLIALGGLGCQNPVSDLPPILPDVRQSASQPSTDAGASWNLMGSGSSQRQ